MGPVTDVRPGAVVFDFDGLIMDTEWCEYASVADVFRAHGQELSLDLWKSFIGSTDHPAWPDILESQLGRSIDRAEWVPAYRLANRTCASGLDILPGVAELIGALAVEAVPMAVASSSSADWVVGHLRERGLLQPFAAVCTGDEVLRTKPDPALYLMACERLAVDPARAVAVEDSVNGVRAARAAGMAVVAVPSSLTAGMDFIHADLVLTSCAELDPGILGSLVGP